jgi:hypothetical protein
MEQHVTTARQALFGLDLQHDVHDELLDIVDFVVSQGH